MKKFYILAFLSAFMIMSCGKDDSSSTDDSDNEGGITDPQEVANLLNDNLNVDGGFTVDPNNVNVTTDVIVNSAAVGRMPVRPGVELVNTITFTPATRLNGAGVTAVGMRFGPTGPIQFREITPEEAEAGIASFVFNIDPAVCEDIAQICHDIKCYEFAQTSAGDITQADLQDIAAVCGACDEPSCLSLLDEGVCESNGIQGASGNPRFNLTWTGSTDLDLYVTDPNGETIYYASSSSASGGALDVDCLGSCAGGNAENIFWENGGPSGNYTYYVNYFEGSDPTPFTVTIFEDNNVISTQTASLSVDGQDSTTWTYTKN